MSNCHIDSAANTADHDVGIAADVIANAVGIATVAGIPNPAHAKEV